LTPKSFKDYYHSQAEKIVMQYDLARKYFDSKAIHEMRVEIKRFRAFFNLVEWINPDFQAQKNFKKIRVIFKAAGKIRDIHVQQEVTRTQIAESNLEVSEYYNHLKQQVIRKQPAFSGVAKTFKINEFNKNWIKIDSALNILPENYIQFKTEERFYSLIDDLISYKEKAPFTANDYHKIRILSKETRYALEILQTCFPELDHFEDLNLKIRDLHRALGKWHDDEIGLLFLYDFMENYADQSFFQKKSYDRFIKNLEQEKKQCLATFEKQWKEFLEMLNHKGSFSFIESKFSLN